MGKMDHQQVRQTIEAVHERLDALLGVQGFVRTERNRAADGRRVNEWVRKSSWREDQVTSMFPLREPKRLEVSVATSLCTDSERSIAMDGTTVSWLAGRDWLLEPRGLDRLRALTRADFLLERVMGDITRGMSWFRAYDTPAKCIERMRSPERNGTRIGTSFHRNSMIFLERLEAAEDGFLELDLVIRGYTTADLSEGTAPARLAATFRRLLAVDDLIVRGGDAEDSLRLSTLGSEEQSGLHAQGGVQFRGPEGQRALARLDWRRISREERDSYLRGQGHRQNSVSIVVERERLQDPAFRDRLVAACRELASAFELNYLAAYNTEATPLTFPTEAELGMGLPGVFWINLFGGPFVELIGEERLLAIPGARGERLPGGRIMVIGPDALLEPAGAEEVAQSLRAAIGEQFFARTPDRPSMDGLRSLGDLLEQASAEGQLQANRAQHTPNFDYRAILLDD